MAPHSEDVVTRTAEPVHTKEAPKGLKEAPNGLKEAPNGLKEASNPTNSSKAPLELKGVLDQFKSFDVTPVIGKEFPDASLVEWLKAPNSDELIRDLAITGSKPLSPSKPQTFVV